MAVIDYPKDELIEQLWLPKVKEAKAFLYPKRRRNAQMVLFTLSDGINLNEILKLEEQNLILRKDSTACVTTMHKRVRVESESVGYVVDERAYDHSFLRPSCSLVNRFPFDILNLDFGSQDPIIEQGRIEEEMKKIEKILSIQSDKECDRFILIYTTIIDSNSIDTQGIVRTFSVDAINDWDEVADGILSVSITDCSLKKDFLRELFSKFPNKYGYQKQGNASYLTVSCVGNSFEMISIAVIITR